jgi:hypothetical protein
VDDALAFIERTGLLERRETDGRIEFTLAGVNVTSVSFELSSMMSSHI